MRWVPKAKRNFKTSLGKPWNRSELHCWWENKVFCAKGSFSMSSAQGSLSLEPPRAGRSLMRSWVLHWVLSKLLTRLHFHGQASHNDDSHLGFTLGLVCSLSWLRDSSVCPLCKPKSLLSSYLSLYSFQSPVAPHQSFRGPNLSSHVYSIWSLLTPLKDLL